MVRTRGGPNRESGFYFPHPWHTSAAGKENGMKKTQEEIEKLKAGWLKDPCWDIEKSEGFEEHEKELLIFRKDREAKTEAKIKERQEARWKKITREVGYLDFETAMSLSTSAEIEGELIRLDNQIEI